MDTVRIWKDPDYRDSLRADLLASVPDSPAGLARLTAEDTQLAGGTLTYTWVPCTLIMCTITGAFCTAAGAP